LGQATDSPDGSKHFKSAAGYVEEYNRADNVSHSSIGLNVETKCKNDKPFVDEFIQYWKNKLTFFMELFHVINRTVR
jgi:hypothetical protein